MNSLRRRVLVSALVVLALFVLLTSLALEHAFRDSARSAREERLLGQLYLLMAAAEERDGTLSVPKELAEPRLGLPDSGLYAAVLDSTGKTLWRSPSAVSVNPPLAGRLPPGEHRTDIRPGTDGRNYLVAGYGVSWAIGPRPARYSFLVAEDLEGYRSELTRFRTALAGWLGAMALLMLTALLSAIHWGLAPLRRVAAELAAMEQGNVERIRGHYPEEVSALTDNLNALLAQEEARRKRLDEALGDLAHSLKTPLAVIRGALEAFGTDSPSAVLADEQVTRMEHIVAHQLQRARAGRDMPPRLMAKVPLVEIIERLVASLARVYRDKALRCTVEGDREAGVRGAEGDLMEVLGNLLDNAFKWAHGQVHVEVKHRDEALEVLVDDDGPGVPPAQAERVLGRGTRADEATPGQGIGLAVARDICQAYGGTLAIELGDLGGTRVRLQLPS